jgi:non-lysosomal glucosylceramidase
MKSFTSDELHRQGSQRVYTGSQLTEIAFPLGGIGTGTISLGGRGNLRDFEIFNHPDKGYIIPFSFFALWAKPEGGDPVAKILEGKIPAPYRSGFGESPAELNGVARFSDVTFTGEYPTATLKLTDRDVPVAAELKAWNPFIPLNVRDSALPAAIFEWTISNPLDVPVEISLSASMENPLSKTDESGKKNREGALNSYQAAGNMRGVLMSHPDANINSSNTGTTAISTPWTNTDCVTRWYRGGWWDKAHLFWDNFAASGKVAPVLDADPAPRHGDVASIILHAVIPANGSVTLPVYITWNFPKLDNPWRDGMESLPAVLDNYVGAHYRDAWAVADYINTSLPRLRTETTCWQQSIFANTLPVHVLEAITSQASIMRTNTCYLLADETFFAWEGCGDKMGCCHGSCTHVWNYEQALAFLFPQLERTMRRTEFLYNTRESGNMAFRTSLPPGGKLWDFKPCADGQMGTIIQVYRDWQLSGDDAFLREIWPGVKRALEYAWTMTPDKMQGGGAGVINAADNEKRSIDSLWDPDKDGVMEGEQHNTYDIEFFGPNTMCTAMYLGALRSCEEIARYLGENDKADEYRAIYESGRAKVDAELWNGEYYIQNVDVIPEVTVPEVLRSPDSDCCGPTCECKQSPGGKKSAMSGNALVPKYQYGEGCLSDQLLGQWASHVAGLGYLLKEENVRTTLLSIFKNNFRAPVGDFNNVQRVYALNDEAGLLLCSWPHGNRPALPFVYSDEVWTGIEYHVAAHLIYEGWVDEGLTIVKAVSDRYAGNNRNPWNQIECGHHYARAMASWSVKLALDGFTYSLPDDKLGFAPKINNAEYTAFWSTGTGWGTYHQNTSIAEFTLTVKYGTQKLKQLELADMPDGEVTINGISAKREGKLVIFDDSLTLSAGESVTIKIG